MWSTKSIQRLIWLYSYCKATLTIWSSENDQLGSNDRLLLLRKYFAKSAVYYDLPEQQHTFFHAYAHDTAELNKYLAKSSDLLVKYYLRNTADLAEYWQSLHGTIMSTLQSALMLNRGATFLSTKQYKAKDNVKIYELHGKFEIFSTTKANNETQAFTNSTDAVNEANDNNIAVNSGDTNNQVTGCIRISLRTSSNLVIYDGFEANVESHSPGSINIYLFTNGLVKMYVGNKLEQEANIPASNNFEYI